MKHSEDIKSEALKLIASGVKQSAVARSLRVSNSTVNRWREEIRLETDDSNPLQEPISGEVALGRVPHK